MKGSQASPDVLEILQALWALAHALEARSKWMQRHLGVTGPRRLLLRVIGAAPGCTPGAAARRLSLNPGTVSRLAAGLERSRLLRAEPDRSDGRQRRLFLTPGGELLNRRQRGTVEAAVREALATATPGEAALARKFIFRLTESLAESGPIRREAGRARRGSGTPPRKPAGAGRSRRRGRHRR